MRAVALSRGVARTEPVVTRRRGGPSARQPSPRERHGSARASVRESRAIADDGKRGRRNDVGRRTDEYVFSRRGHLRDVPRRGGVRSRRLRIVGRNRASDSRRRGGGRPRRRENRKRVRALRGRAARARGAPRAGAASATTVAAATDHRHPRRGVRHVAAAVAGRSGRRSAADADAALGVLDRAAPAAVRGVVAARAAAAADDDESVTARGGTRVVSREGAGYLRVVRLHVPGRGGGRVLLRRELSRAGKRRLLRGLSGDVRGRRREARAREGNRRTNGSKTIR